MNDNRFFASQLQLNTLKSAGRLRLWHAFMAPGNYLFDKNWQE